jgi:hypothetical protein
MRVKEDEFDGFASGEDAERALGEIAKERIAQREKTKRLLIVMVSILFSLGTIVAVFAPQGKEVVGGALGGALIVLALGAIGASRFLLKLPGAYVDTHVGNGQNSKNLHMKFEDDN